MLLKIWSTIFFHKTTVFVIHSFIHSFYVLFGIRRIGIRWNGIRQNGTEPFVIQDNA